MTVLLLHDIVRLYDLARAWLFCLITYSKCYSGETLSSVLKTEVDQILRDEQAGFRSAGNCAEWRSFLRPMLVHNLEPQELRSKIRILCKPVTRQFETKHTFGKIARESARMKTV